MHPVAFNILRETVMQTSIGGVVSRHGARHRREGGLRGHGGVLPPRPRGLGEAVRMTGEIRRPGDRNPGVTAPAQHAGMQQIRKIAATAYDRLARLLEWSRQLG